MSKFLTVYDDVSHALEALDPKNATGIGLPAFAIGNSLPAAGQVVGEGFLVAPTKTGYLWDGTRWVPIVPSALLNYATDALVLADKTQSPGSYATSSATGNLFIALTGGLWHQVGVRSYATEAGMKADTNALEGDTAWTQDTNQLWYFVGGKWFTLGTHYYATEAALIADLANAGGGAVACAIDTGLLFSAPTTNLVTSWQPMSIAQFPDEAHMRAKTTDNVANQIAITQDTHRIYVWNGTRWTGSPTEYFATEAALLAATADAGTLGIAGDTAKAYIRTSTGWNPLAGPTMTAGIALPTTGMATGDMFYNITTKTLYVRGSSTWDAVSGGGVQVFADASHFPTTKKAGDTYFAQDSKQLYVVETDGTATATDLKVLDQHTLRGDVTLGTNATTPGNEVILIKGILASNESIYVDISDAYISSERASYALHLFGTASSGGAPMAPIHIYAAGSHFEYLRFYWKDATDGYCLSAKIAVGHDGHGVVYHVALRFPNALDSGVSFDGNTLVTPTIGTTINAMLNYPQPSAPSVTSRVINHSGATGSGSDSTQVWRHDIVENGIYEIQVSASVTNASRFGVAFFAANGSRLTAGSGSEDLSGMCISTWMTAGNSCVEAIVPVTDDSLYGEEHGKCIRALPHAGNTTDTLIENTPGHFKVTVDNSGPRSYIEIETFAKRTSGSLNISNRFHFLSTSDVKKARNISILCMNGATTATWRGWEKTTKIS